MSEIATIVPIRGTTTANAERLVSCVNALEGKEKPEEWVKATEELIDAAKKFLKVIPVDVLRMQAGNSFLDMGAVDSSKTRLQSALEKVKA